MLAIQALAWALGDDNRAQRLLALTGLTPDGLRYGIGDTGLQAAVLGFLESHEPDLLACAVAIDVSPAALILAKRQLEGTDIYG
ncbi:MAG: DUF3572 domain-containing protein [Sphingomonadales bacterium]|nr:DUF3572 domain-containing protein [Sphingomonadales bacterium]